MFFHCVCTDGINVSYRHTLYCIILYNNLHTVPSPPRRYMLRSLPVRGAIYIQNYISLRLKIQRRRILWDFVLDNMTLHLRTLAMMDQGLVITHHTRYTIMSSRTLHFDSRPSLKSVKIEVHPSKMTHHTSCVKSFTVRHSWFFRPTPARGWETSAKIELSRFKSWWNLWLQKEAMAEGFGDVLIFLQMAVLCKLYVDHFQSS